MVSSDAIVAMDAVRSSLEPLDFTLLDEITPTMFSWPVESGSHRKARWTDSPKISEILSSISWTPLVLDKDDQCEEKRPSAIGATAVEVGDESREESSEGNPGESIGDSPYLGGLLAVARRKLGMGLKLSRTEQDALEMLQFSVSDLRDLRGSTASAVRRMSSKERRLVLYKRKLRNRESARRCRERKRLENVSDQNVWEVFKS